MKSSFITEEGLKMIQENYRGIENVELKKVQDSFRGYLNEMSQQHSMIGYIGKFGTGKTTVLDGIKKNRNEEWFTFDAWKYPDRDKLWESLLLSMAEKESRKHFCIFQLKSWLWIRKTYVKSKILGKQKVFFSSIIAACAIFLGLLLYWQGISIPDTIKTLLNDSAAVLGLLGVLYFFFPFMNVDDLHKELLKLLKTRMKNENDSFVIIVEDVDRCDKAGIHFLETLNYFLNKHGQSLKGKLRVIVPLDTKRFEDKMDEYLKCMDAVEFPLFSILDVNWFLRTSLGGKFLKESNSVQILLKGLLTLPDYSKQTSIRTIKLIFRNAHNRYLNLMRASKGVNKIDWRMVVAIEASRLYKYRNEQSTKEESCTKFFDGSANILKINSPFRNFFRHFILDVSNREIDLVKEDYTVIFGKDPLEDVEINLRPKHNLSSCEVFIPRFYVEIAMNRMPQEGRMRMIPIRMMPVFRWNGRIKSPEERGGTRN